MDAVLSKTAGVKNPASSAWIDLLKVILTVGIVCRHATWAEVGRDLPLFQNVTRGITAITEICVPLFFVLSGYLFFLNCPEKPTAGYFGAKLKRRVFTLLIPYLIAVVIAFGCYWAAGRYAPSLVSGYFGDKLYDPVFVFWTGPINLSLWFIRELMVCCLLSPLVWLLVRYTRVFGVIALGALWAFHIGPMPIFCFTLGAWPAIRNLHIKGLSDWMERHPVKVTPASRAWCYFIYLYHYLLLIGVKKGLVAVLNPSTSWGYLGCYVLSVVIVLALMTGLFYLMRRFLPRITGVLIGGK